MTLDYIFQHHTKAQFEDIALAMFKKQYANNNVYREFCNLMQVNVAAVQSIKEIPFLPIEFFKSREIIAEEKTAETTFTSSGTTGNLTSKHLVSDISVYKKSYLKGFSHFYNNPEEYCILALLPAYLEREGSSLIYMVNDLIKRSGRLQSGFYLNDLDRLHHQLLALEAAGTKTLLIGVSFALLDFVEQYTMKLQNTIVMETGGMKGRRKEMIREELHWQLKKGFGVDKIHSEYGMTELLSQGYSKGNSRFNTPPWMKVLIRDTDDPLTYQAFGKTGGINVIDLANVNSCAFIATQDLGRYYDDGSFEILGRFDRSDVRGCNLMVL